MQGAQDPSILRHIAAGLSQLDGLVTTIDVSGLAYLERLNVSELVTMQSLARLERIGRLDVRVVDRCQIGQRAERQPKADRGIPRRQIEPLAPQRAMRGSW